MHAICLLLQGVGSHYSSEESDLWFDKKVGGTEESELICCGVLLQVSVRNARFTYVLGRMMLRAAEPWRRKLDGGSLHSIMVSASNLDKFITAGTLQVAHHPSLQCLG